jgi:DinB family protein
MLITTRVETALERFAALDERELAQPWRFHDKPTDIRYALYRTIEEAQGALVSAAAQPHPESRRILSLGQRAFGDLRGLLIGLPGELLDRTPRDGEWPVREILRHIIVIERRYAVQTRYAVERADTDPIRVADSKLPTPAQTDVTGGILEVLARLDEARAESARQLGDLPAAAMTRPTQWIQYDVDVRFRLHRFAAHIVEHTVQCEKALATLGWRATEGRRVVRRLTALLGEVEGLAGRAGVREIEQRLVERSASLAPA